MPGLGDEFRVAREARGLSLSDVAEQIHIRSIYLQAIENEDWAAIGPAVYIRGFLRTYARFLGLNGEDAVARLNQAGLPRSEVTGSAPARLTRRESPAVAPPRTGPSIWLWLAGGIAVLLVAFLGYNYYLLQAGDRIPPSRVAAVTTPAATPTQSGTAEPTATVDVTAAPSPVVPPQQPKPRPSGPTLTVRVTQPSWIRVTVDGTVAFEGTYPAGTVKTVHGRAADVRIGNAGGVEVIVNGRNIGTLGASGDVVERAFALRE